MARWNHTFRRRKANQSESLETRTLLTGTVRVAMVGNDLVITGDRFDNSVTIAPSAESADELIQGLDGTDIQFARNFETRFASRRLDDVRIRMRGGDDTIIVNAEGATLPDNVKIILGAGDDCVSILGDAQNSANIDGHLTIRGRGGDDDVHLDHVDILGSFRTSGAGGKDVLAVNSVDVGGRSIIRSQSRRDTLIDADDEVTPTDATDEAIAGLWDKFTELAPELPSDTADQMQDAIVDLGDTFDTTLVELDLDPASQRVTATDPTPTVSVLWDRAVQEAVVNTGPGPTISSRAYAMMHTAMFDAWSAYDETAVSTQLADNLQQPATENTEDNKREAMSFAAYRVLDDLFASQTEVFDSLMDELGFDPTNTATTGSSPAAIGNQMAEALLVFRHNDGSNQLGDDPNGTDGEAYSDTSNYTPSNDVGAPTLMDKWTPERVPIDAEPNENSTVQEFLTPHWGSVTPFGIESGDSIRPAEPEPFLLVDGATVDPDAKTITLADQTVEQIDRDLIGTIINPAFIEQTEEVIAFSANLTDEQKMIAEFWEDGGDTAFPPGTFMTFGQFVSARDNNSLDEDARLFFALGNAVFDAGIATWEAKLHYDYVRPVRAVRELGELGLIGEFDESLGGFAIEAWTPEAGTQTILATDFLTYQTPGSDPSPPFAEYTSGHSAFSAAGAAVLELFTGSDEFDASVTFEAGSSRFEPVTTPSNAVTLAWDTFSAAADEAGLSRLYGGIHFTDGDLRGRTLGREAGQAAWGRAQQFINGQNPDA